MTYATSIYPKNEEIYTDLQNTFYDTKNIYSEFLSKPYNTLFHVYVFQKKHYIKRTLSDITSKLREVCKLLEGNVKFSLVEKTTQA